ncbi:MAG TPA: hypothetical protein VFR38_16890 [Gaiellaceae bacterium]|nr:hypothetical protein [Gaiellaceae bacterium]
MNERLLKDLLWLLAVMTACGVLALAISTALGVPAKYVPGVLFWTMIPGFVGYAAWIRRRR